MSRKIFTSGYRLGFMPFLSNIFTADKPDPATIKTAPVAEQLAKETGWDGIKAMFKTDEFGNITHELNSILQTTWLSLFAGLLYGGTLEGQKAYEKFMRNNQVTSFTTHLEAKRKLQDAITLALGKGAFKWGLKIGFFSTTYVATATVIQVYRGKYGIIEYAAAGAVAGFAYKFYSGPRGWIVGSGLGVVLGLVCGVTTLGILKLSGLSLQEARYYQYRWLESRNEAVKKGLASYMEKDDFAVIKMHNDEVGEAGKSLDNLDANVNSSSSSSTVKGD
ncbi:RPII140-upstream gene protein [Anthonomus grandis grandis]|uniref:RPII140-upstream gene protein n=1 Tax=Anthonomus grandis grandis TaxID=2921223 RepID=UPI0021651D2B|nr:RPII140-upstream gene protein [Anthonomus grandis grandis]